MLQDPRHPYTVGLLRCIPRGGVRKDHGRLDTIPGFLPSLGARARRAACSPTAARSPTIAAAREEPPLEAIGAGHASRCFYHEQAAGPSARGRRPTSTLPAVDRAARAAAAGRRPRQDLPAARATTSTRSSASARRSGPARRSGSSASRAAARRRSRGRCSGSSRRRAGAVELDGQRAARRATRSARRRDLRVAPDRLPEPRLGAQPAPLGAAHPAPLDEEARRASSGEAAEQRVARARAVACGSPSAR